MRLKGNTERTPSSSKLLLFIRKVLMNKKLKPQKGEIWKFRPRATVGSEIQKLRPAIVVNEEFMGRISLNIIVPVTSWKKSYEQFPWMIYLRANRINRLEKDSGADASQVKSISTQRFDQKIGIINLEELQEILAAIVLCIGFECPYCRLN